MITPLKKSTSQAFGASFYTAGRSKPTKIELIDAEQALIHAKVTVLLVDQKRRSRSKHPPSHHHKLWSIQEVSGQRKLPANAT
jgi:hypothetical protein